MYISLQLAEEKTRVARIFVTISSRFVWFIHVSALIHI